MKIYISGPVTGMPNDNELAFLEAERKLKELDYIPVNPVRLCKEAGITEWHACMNEICIPALMECDAMILLDGWQKSKGANVEIDEARLHHIPIIKLF
jgi:hypothetical protein